LQDWFRNIKLALTRAGVTVRSLVCSLIGLSFVVLAASACDRTPELVFGPEPLRQMTDDSAQFVEYSEGDRLLLLGYLNSIEVARSFGWQTKPAVGRPVDEVMDEARAWKKKLDAEAAAATDHANRN